MEDLTKQQLVLLVLLLSFVTSIATGIITVSLLNEAPQEVTQTINRIVEKTIERVVPVETPGKVTETREIKEVTTIVKEEELVIDSIEKNGRSVARISRLGESGGFYAMGAVFSNDGVIVAPVRNFLEGSSYRATFFDGATSTLEVLGADTQTGILYLKASFGSSSTPYKFYPAVIAKAPLKLGQSVIALGGQETTGVATGRVSSFEFKDETVKKEGQPDAVSTVTTLIRTDISSGEEVAGSILLNLSGEMAGIHILLEKGTYLPVAQIKSTAASTTPALR